MNVYGTRTTKPNSRLCNIHRAQIAREDEIEEDDVGVEDLEEHEEAVYCELRDIRLA